MQRIKYKITTLSSILIPSATADPNMTETLEFIPGSVILGVYANLFPVVQGENDKSHNSDFFEWFLQGKLRFTNAYFARHNRIYFPLPLSIQQEKEEPLRLWDLLMSNPEESQTKSYKGFGAIEDQKLYVAAISTSLHFHHTRDEKTGTSKKGMIFHYQAISPCQTFEGSIVGERGDLEKFVEQFGQPNPRIIYIGKSKNAQYGRAELQLLSQIPEDFVCDLPGKGDWDDDSTSLTFLSDTIVYDDNGFSTTDLRNLAKYLSKQGKFEIHKAFVKAARVENFRSVWRLKTPSETCFAAGSCFQIKADSQAQSQLKVWQQEGIGERCQEGFGRIALGWQREEKLDKYQKTSDAKRQKPEGKIPPLSREIATEILRQAVEKNVQLKALEDAREYKGLPTKSLLSRLEAMARQQNKTEFRTNVQNLRKTARDKLQGCRNKRTSLFDHIQEWNLSPENLALQGMEKMEKLVEEIGFTVDDKKLYHVYFETFFTAMRKQLKEFEKKQAQKKEETHERR